MYLHVTAVFAYMLRFKLLMKKKEMILNGKTTCLILRSKGTMKFILKAMINTLSIQSNLKKME